MATAKRNICSADSLIACAIRFMLTAFRYIPSEYRYKSSAEKNVLTADRFIAYLIRFILSAIRYIPSAKRNMLTAKTTKYNIPYIKGHPTTAVWRNWGFRQTLKLVLYSEVRSLIYTFG
jgi:hypothetical protein